MTAAMTGLGAGTVRSPGWSRGGDGEHDGTRLLKSSECCCFWAQVAVTLLGGRYHCA
jgi:hypothetical protein